MPANAVRSDGVAAAALRRRSAAVRAFEPVPRSAVAAVFSPRGASARTARRVVLHAGALASPHAVASAPLPVAAASTRAAGASAAGAAANAPAARASLLARFASQSAARRARHAAARASPLSRAAAPPPFDAAAVPRAASPGPSAAAAAAAASPALSPREALLASPSLRRVRDCARLAGAFAGGCGGWRGARRVVARTCSARGGAMRWWRRLLRQRWREGLGAQHVLGPWVRTARGRSRGRQRRRVRRAPPICSSTVRAAARRVAVGGFARWRRSACVGKGSVRRGACRVQPHARARAASCGARPTRNRTIGGRRSEPRALDSRRLARMVGMGCVGGALRAVPIARARAFAGGLGRRYAVRAPPGNASSTRAAARCA
jgi:hypothetical protein